MMSDMGACYLGIAVTAVLVCLFVYLQKKYQIFGIPITQRMEQIRLFLQPMLGGASLAVATVIVVLFARGTSAGAYTVAASITVGACGGPEWARVVGRIADCLEFERDRNECKQRAGPSPLGDEIDRCVERQWELRQMRRQGTQ